MGNTKPKHTPKPWTVDKSGMYLYVRGNLSDRKHLAHEEIVARVSHLDDAALIAAAPELLEALELALGLSGLGKARDYSNSLSENEIVNKCLAVITKARGES